MAKRISEFVNSRFLRKQATHKGNLLTGAGIDRQFKATSEDLAAVERAIIAHASRHSGQNAAPARPAPAQPPSFKV